MSISNSNSSEKQENIRSNEYLSAYLYKKNQNTQKDCKGKNNQLNKNTILQEQTQNQFQSKQENQIVTEIQAQENVANQFYLPKRRYKRSSSQERKSKTQPKLNEIEETQQQTLKKVRKHSQRKIQRSLCVKIQIIQYNNNVQTIENYVSPEIAAQQLQNKIKQQKNEQIPIQQIQSNIFQLQSREIINRTSKNQVIISEIDRENQNKFFNQKKLTNFEIKMGFDNDQKLKEKQNILSDTYEILKQNPIKSNKKRHSILEDCLQLCILLLPNIRENKEQISSFQFYQKIKLQYNLNRTHQAFLRRFYHLLLFSSCWTIQNIQKMHDIIKNLELNQLEALHINYSILKKRIEFPSINLQKKSPQKPKVVEEIITNSQKKKIVLSLTTKTLCQYVNISAKEIDEDIQEFDDELQFIDMILQLIPLAL
ncbi:unnamed protein product [Paramecium sonneborni]|uniref:Uncharacterized protein n=1 Tax=Paramecium sonneborni TaxID=65129 RepID=A0A8S1RB23_9CILI|nr:unnamed protein product [Paramecium sonneborni]